MNATGTNIADAWEQFAGTTTVSGNDRPDRYYCRACGEVWATKEGSRGFNRCGNCGAIYRNEHLLKLTKPTDRCIHLMADGGVTVTVQRSMLASVWQNFAANPVNARLAAEQGVDVTILPATVLTVALLPANAPSTATSDPADWERFARSNR